MQQQSADPGISSQVGDLAQIRAVLNAAANLTIDQIEPLLNGRNNIRRAVARRHPGRVVVTEQYRTADGAKRGAQIPGRGCKPGVEIARRTQALPYLIDQSPVLGFVIAAKYLLAEERELHD